MKKLFFGGIHPNSKKELSLNNIDVQAIAPEKVVMSLRQHIGVECKPLVKEGDYVLVGQKIADGEGMCVPVHSSVSGTVVKIEPHISCKNDKVMSIIIENDFQNKEYTYEVNKDEDLVDLVREKGIIGMGGAAFPTYIKKASALSKVDTVIANGCECEPYITSDDVLMRTRAEEVLQGILVVGNYLKPKRLVLAIEDNKVEAIAKLQSLKEKYSDIEIKVLPTRYPQGAEKQLIQAVTGREVPAGGLPVDVNCVVFNVATYAAINAAVKTGKPLTERLVTVSGEGVNNPQNFLVKIGTPVEDLIKAAGGLKEGATRIINGGPMMGSAFSDLTAPVTKATNSILCLEGEIEEHFSKCIRCGKCLSVCPMKLQPLYLYKFAKAENYVKLDKLNLFDCMTCGSCSFVCPAKLPLAETFRDAKPVLKEVKAKCN